MARPLRGPDPPGNPAFDTYLQERREERRRALHKLVHMLADKQYDFTNSTVFRQALAGATEGCGVKYVQIAEELGEISPAAVGRWISGENRPPKFSREAIIDKLRTLLLRIAHN